MIFDTHAHYDDSQFAEDQAKIIERFPVCGVGNAVNVAATVESMDECVRLTRVYAPLYGAVGVHPSECGEMRPEDVEHLKELLTEEKIVAVGEIGLDYHYDGPSRELQQHWFREQLRAAREMDYPVIIHSRDAAEDTLRILREFYPEKETGGKIHGVIHCYSYSPEMAEIFVAMGFMIGIGGVLTFKNAKKLKETAQRIPLSRIVLETDCPYMAPEPHRGERNSSLFLPHVVKVLAQLREISEEEAVKATEQNARMLYRL